MTRGQTKSQKATIVLTSQSFADGEALPERFSCEGEGISPPLSWSGLPDSAKGVALIADDPDAPDPKAPQRTFVHWVLYDIPPSATELPAGATRDTVPVGTRIGTNDGGKSGWYPACPPIGRHRYFFKIYALDTQLGALAEPTKAGLEKAMQGHIVGQGMLMGTYEKKK
jgi:Raf kinase inhibitor-like YbhB/YbcL family protein